MFRIRGSRWNPDVSKDECAADEFSDCIAEKLECLQVSHIRVIKLVIFLGQGTRDKKDDYTTWIVLSWFVWLEIFHALIHEIAHKILVNRNCENLRRELIWLISKLWMLSNLKFEIFTSLRDGNRPHRIVGQPLVTANDVGHWDQKHPKVLVVGKKNAKNLIAMYSGPTQFKK